MRTHTISVLVVIVLAASAAACGSDDPIPVETRSTATTESAATTEAPTTTEAPATTEAPTTTAQPTTTIPEVDPVAYLDGVFNGDLNDPAALYADAAPGSPAALYGAHQANLRLAVRDAGQPDPGGAQVTRDGDTVKVCAFDGFGEVVDDCSIYGGFVVEGGYLYTFTIDDVALEGRLGAEGDVVAAVGVDARAVSSYRSIQSDNLFVVIEFTAATPTNLSLYSATYVDPTGRQIDAAESYGPDELRAGARALAMLTFPQADPGGTVFIDVYADDFSADGELAVAVPAATFE